MGAGGRGGPAHGDRAAPRAPARAASSRPATLATSTWRTDMETSRVSLPGGRQRPGTSCHCMGSAQPVATRVIAGTCRASHCRTSRRAAVRTADTAWTERANPRSHRRHNSRSRAERACGGRRGRQYAGRRSGQENRGTGCTVVTARSCQAAQAQNPFPSAHGSTREDAGARACASNPHPRINGSAAISFERAHMGPRPAARAAACASRSVC